MANGRKSLYTVGYIHATIIVLLILVIFLSTIILVKAQQLWVVSDSNILLEIVAGIGVTAFCALAIYVSILFYEPFSDKFGDLFTGIRANFEDYERNRSESLENEIDAVVEIWNANSSGGEE